MAIPFDDLRHRNLFRYLIKGIYLDGDVAKGAALLNVFSQAPEHAEGVAGQYALPKAGYVPIIIVL